LNLHYTFSSPVGWVAERLEALPSAALRRALVLTPSERLAHAIRRELVVARRRPDCLAGVGIVRPGDLARQLLARAGRPRLPGWEPLRHARILRLLQSGALAMRMTYFESAQLRAGQGYADALADAILDLEASGLVADDLERIAAALDDRSAGRLRDLAIVWRAADEGAGDWRTAAQILAEATTLLGVHGSAPTTHREPPQQADARTGQLSFSDLVAQPTLAGAAPDALDLALPPVFAVLNAAPSAVLLRFLRALPDVQIVFQDARPLRTDTHRWRSLLAARPAVAAAETLGGEVGIVRRFLFETPENLTDPLRARSAGADGSVDLEEHAGIEEEVDATATWVVEQIAAGIPLERIAVITPEKGSYADLLVDRLARVRGADDPTGVPVYVAGGMPLAESPAGRRLLAVLAALARGLDLDATLRIFPALRRSGQAADAPSMRLSPSRSAEIVFQAGIAGGGAGDRDGMRQWGERLRAYRTRLMELVAAVDAQQAPERVFVIEAVNARRWLRDVEPILPALDALQALAVSVADGVALADLWPALSEFWCKHLLLPADPPQIIALLQRVLEPALADASIAALPAPLALRWIGARLQRERHPVGRFGEPRVFVGTPTQAAGLPFDAVRVVGLTEGGLPRSPHDDPIIPDELRVRIEHAAHAATPDVIVPRLADRVLDDLHGVFRVVSATCQRLALSVPRQWVDRSEREVSGIVLEVATALARPTGTGDDGDVPTAGRLRSLYFAAGAQARRIGAERWPIATRSVLAQVARAGAVGGQLRVPETWLEPGPLALDRVRLLIASSVAPEFGAIDGVVGELYHRWQNLGSAERPISASAIHLLLGCPHRFLLERVLHWKEPPRRPTVDAIDPVAYGAIFHRIAEIFLGEAGAQICRKEGSPEWWARRAREIAAGELDRLLEHYPLRGSEARARERQRLFTQVDSLVRDEWDRPARTFVASELDFGNPAAIGVPADAAILHLWGAIDRVDQLADGTLSVRDIKTGRIRDLGEEEVNETRDLQIGLYTFIAEALSGGTQHVGEAAYVHPSTAQEPERAFRAAQLEGLKQRTREWLRVAAELLAKGTFVRTPNLDDCRGCPFIPRCGDSAQAASEMKLVAVAQADTLAGFLAMKRERKFEE